MHYMVVMPRFVHPRRCDAQPVRTTRSQPLSLIGLLKQEDPQTWAHSARIWQLMERVGREMGLFRKYPKESIRLGCLLHDIGKLGISKGILQKPARLTDEEFAVIKTHCAIGESMIHGLGLDRIACRMIRHHHERQDGSGYPDRLLAPEIPDYVRLLAICDCFDALTSDRPYRKAMTAQAALTVLRAEVAAGKLDPSAFSALERLYVGEGTSANRRSPVLSQHGRRLPHMATLRSSGWNVLRRSSLC
jgi:putative nucleotidyltransferase with HDIG domain